MLKTNRNGSGFDREYTVASGVTVAAGDMVKLSSGKVALATDSDVPFGVAVNGGGEGEVISVTLNVPGIEWEADTNADVSVAGGLFIPADAKKLKTDASGIFKVTEVLSARKVLGYFTSF